MQGDVKVWNLEFGVRLRNAITFLGQTKRVKRKERKRKGGKIIKKEEGISLLLLMCCNPNVQRCFLSFRLIEKNQISNLLAFLNAISNPLGYRLLPTTMLN